MSAITGYLERSPKEVAADEGRTKVELVHNLSGLDGGPPPLSDAHGKLTRMVWHRKVLEEAMAGRRIDVVVKQGRYVFQVTPGVELDVIPWSPAGKPTAKPFANFSMWGWAGKMSCPTWDLPAGDVSVGGACPGAKPGQTVVPDAERQKAAAATDMRFKPNVSKAICQSCVTGDTLVLVRGEGLVRIDVLVGRGPVVVWSGLGWRETHAVFNGVKPTRELRLSNGQRLRLTDDHDIILPTGRVRADELEIDEGLPLQLPDEIPFPMQAPLPPIDLGEAYKTEKRGALPVEWSRELGTWLGYLVGDGWFNQGNAYPSLGICAAAQDRDDLDRLVPLVAAWTGSAAEVHVDQPPPSAMTATPQPMAHITWRQKSAVALARALGLAKRKTETTTPDSIWTASRDGVAGFLSGLFSTDGCVSVGVGSIEVSFANTAKSLVEDVQLLLFSFGIRGNICEYKSNRERGYSALWKISIRSRESLLQFKEHIGFFNQRKQKKFADALTTKLPASSRNVLLRVESNVATGKSEPVFDLVNVGEEHQFTANGISVSNCYAYTGQYTQLQAQGGEIIRYWWVKSLLGDPQRLATDIYRSLLQEQFPVTPFTYRGQSLRPVRVHSSGDFFSTAYFDAWLLVARMAWADNHPIRFWCPTRMWVYPKIREHMQEGLAALARDGIDNFMVRASAYHFNDAAPKALVKGNSKGSTSIYANEPMAGRADYQCPVYADIVKGGEATCGAVPNKDSPGANKRGCRVCWMKPQLSVNYSAHFG